MIFTRAFTPAITFFTLCYLLVGRCEALDWIQLHEKADSLTLNEAEQQIDEVTASLEALYVLGLVYLNEEKNTEADSIFDAMLERSAELTEARWGKAEVLRRKHMLREAQERLRELTNFYPDFSPAYISLAYIEYIQMNFEEAAALTRRVIKQGKENVDLNNFVRAHALYAGAKGMIAHYGGPISKMINGRQILPYLRKAQELDPDSPAVLFGLGSYFFLTPAILGRDLNKAKEYLLQAAEKAPQFADIYVRLAQVYLYEGNEEQYNEYLDKALSIDPGNELALDIKTRTCNFICISNLD